MRILSLFVDLFDAVNEFPADVIHDLNSIVESICDVEFTTVINDHISGQFKAAISYALSSEVLK